MYLGNSPALNYTSLATQTFTVVTGQTQYSLDHSVANGNDILLYIANVKQVEGNSNSYTATGNILTLNTSISANTEMYCLFVSKAIQTVNPPNASVGTSQLVDGAVTDNKFSGTKGITSAQEFRLVASQSGSGSLGTVLTNWEENDTDYQAIGSNWSQSSGIFSSSATGIYTASWSLVVTGASSSDAFDPNIQISTNSGSDYSARSQCWEYVHSNDTTASVSATFMFAVSNTSTFRLRFRQSKTNDIGTTTTIEGSSTKSLTNIVFVRLGDI